MRRRLWEAWQREAGGYHETTYHSHYWPLSLSILHPIWKLSSEVADYLVKAKQKRKRRMDT